MLPVSFSRSLKVSHQKDTDGVNEAYKAITSALEAEKAFDIALENNSLTFKIGYGKSIYGDRMIGSSLSFLDLISYGTISLFVREGQLIATYKAVYLKWWLMTIPPFLAVITILAALPSIGKILIMVLVAFWVGLVLLYLMIPTLILETVIKRAIDSSIM
jgi:hypothetical protein